MHPLDLHKINFAGIISFINALEVQLNEQFYVRFSG